MADPATLALSALLISPPELLPAWQAYAEARQDVKIEVISTAQIENDFQGPDLQEKIRLCARQAIDKKGVTSIILGGDSSGDGGLIPDRDTFHMNMWGNDQDIPSDLYYLSPTNWDADGDGVYGEWEDDREAITYPDGTVGIGRIPMRTPEDVANYAAKVAIYQKQKKGGMVMTCAVEGANAKVFRSGKEFIPAAWKEEKVKFFFNDYTSWNSEENQGSYDLTPEHLAAQMNSGQITKWHIHGHGLIDRWILEHEAPFTMAQVARLKNDKHFSVITTVSCFTGQFDNAQDPCITEAMLRQSQAGAIAIIAPAREGKPHFHDPQKDFPLMMEEGKLDGTTETMTLFWINALGENHRTGHALALAKKKLGEDAKKSATYHQGICEINLLGDPTLFVR